MAEAKMSLSTNEPTAGTELLNRFRTYIGSTIDGRPEIQSVATKLNFDESFDLLAKRKLTVDKRIYDECKRRKVDIEPSAEDVLAKKLADTEIQLANANATNKRMEFIISELKASKEELQCKLQREIKSLKLHTSHDKTKILELEDQIKSLKTVKGEFKSEALEYQTKMNSAKFNFASKIRTLQNQLHEEKEKNLQLKSDFEEEKQNLETELGEKTLELREAAEELQQCRHQIDQLKKDVADKAQLRSHVAHLEQMIQASKNRVQELEHEREKFEISYGLVNSQKNRLIQYPDLEKEATNLREENKHLREAIRNKLLLEEMVVDLQHRVQMSDEKLSDYTKLQLNKENLEKKLSEWEALVRNYCSIDNQDFDLPLPFHLKQKMDSLQQKELILTDETSEMQKKLKYAEQARDSLSQQLNSTNERFERLQQTHEQHVALLRRLRKKLLLVTRERDSYRSLLDSYEKDLTMSGDITIQGNKSRVEVLERAIEGHRELSEKLEKDLEETKQALQQAKSSPPSNPKLEEKLKTLTEENEKLVAEKAAFAAEREKLIEEKEILEAKLEDVNLKGGDFNPMTTKIVHFKNNPAALAESQRSGEIARLQEECIKLRERLKVLGEGQSANLTMEVEKRVQECGGVKDVIELREKVNLYEVKIDRLKEAFKKTSKEFREVCHDLIGYKIDMQPGSGSNNKYKLTNMYAESPQDYLIFEYEDGNLSLLETPYSLKLDKMIDLHLRHQRSIPVFLSSITLDLFGRRTIYMDEPITID